MTAGIEPAREVAGPATGAIRVGQLMHEGVLNCGRDESPSVDRRGGAGTPSRRLRWQ